jgi:superfamily II DNA or RNA helicase
MGKGLALLSSRQFAAIWLALPAPKLLCYDDSVEFIPVKVTNELRLNGNLIGQDLADQIFDELTIPNQDKWRAKQMKIWKWQDMPDDFLLADLDGDEIVLPRGYAHQLKFLLQENGMTPFWSDYRIGRRGSKLHWKEKFSARGHQNKAVRLMRRHQQGMYEAPTGSGKTLSCLKFIHDVHPLRTIILTDQKHLLNQWIKECTKWFGGEYVGQVGSGVWQDDKRITIATVQTIHRAVKDNKINNDWFDDFDCVIVDECHHVSAKSIQEIVSRFCAYWRLGVSATPDRQNGKFEFCLAILGELFHSTKDKPLQDEGLLIKPDIEVIDTDFDFEYDEDDPKAYIKIRKALVHDTSRNNRIAETVIEHLDNHTIHLLVTSETKHLDNIKHSLEEYELDRPIYVLKGKTTKKQREIILAELGKNERSIVLATIGKEGLDVPPVDAVYLPYPHSNPTITKQIIGRATRASPGKDRAVGYDFRDKQVDWLKKQFKRRRNGCYDKLDLEVKLP